MIREKNVLYFTEEDKKNAIIHKYTDAELKEMETKFRKKSNVRRVILIVLLVTMFFVSNQIESLQYPIYIAISFLIFVALLYEYIDRINIKAVRRKYYIEITIDEKMKIETYLAQTLSPGVCVSNYYPVKGTITGTNYQSVFYVEQAQYNADIGEKVRISVKENHL